MIQSMYINAFTGAVRHLIIINVLMFFGTYIVLGPETYSADVEGFSDLGRLIFALFLPGSPHFRPWQIITHMFMHADPGHLIFNMIALFFFGPPIERVWGSFRFVSYYVLCGLGAAMLQIASIWWQFSGDFALAAAFGGSMLGASGAIFGVLTGFAWLFPNQVISLIFPPISMKAKYFVPIIALLELFYGVRGYATGIAHFAHLGGALCGFLLLMMWYKPFQK